jgi:hypothetical protein
MTHNFLRFLISLQTVQLLNASTLLPSPEQIKRRAGILLSRAFPWIWPNLKFLDALKMRGLASRQQRKIFLYKTIRLVGGEHGGLKETIPDIVPRRGRFEGVFFSGSP